METIRDVDGVVKALRALRGFAAFKDAVTGRGADAGHIGGVHGSLLALLLTGLARERGVPPILLVVPTGRDADELRVDLDHLGAPDVRFLPAGDAEALERGEALAAWSGKVPWLTVAPVSVCFEALPDGAALSEREFRLAVGDALTPEALASVCGEAGLERTAVVLEPGQFAVRGDLLDIFDRRMTRPLRVELFDDKVESLRSFDPATQVSVATHEAAAILKEALGASRCTASLADHCDRKTVVLARDPARLEQASALHVSRLDEADREPARRRKDALSSFRELSVTRARGGLTGSVDLGATTVTTEGNGLDAAVRTLDRISRGRTATLLGFESDTERETLFAALRGPQAPKEAAEILRRPLVVLPFALSEGFLAPGLGFASVSHHELMGGTPAPRLETRDDAPPPEARALDSFLDLEVGDYVVHLVHGIGRLARFERMQRGGAEQDFLVLEFADGVNIFVPAAKIDLVQKYVGGRGATPDLSKVGSVSWQRKKEAAAQAANDIAADLLDLAAVRARAQGIAHPEDSPWQAAFEAAFPHTLTTDQEKSVRAIKADLESRRPMDRLVCGDVGFGKTEVALRAAFKVAMGGRQVAVLVPTTILADQHGRTFEDRLKDFPVTVEVLTRFKTKSQIVESLGRVRAGTTDIVVGTHRLLGEDVVFKDLGLLVIDEEQRFGVAHKDRLRLMRREVDVLSLSATPIPRTLNQAMTGIRDISTLSDPPRGRKPVISEVVERKPQVLKNAVLREMDRGGQTFLVHNRIDTLSRIVAELRDLVPGVRVVVGHGQMEAAELHRAMETFRAGRADVLVSTTIVESGLDIPRANTLIVDDAHRYGLAELHQLRGRVGRSDVQAYALFLTGRDTVPSEESERRLLAIEEFSGLGAGFQIALRDLEIRGAGNILGAEQSGHIAAVGYELYCRLLDMAVKRLKHERIVAPDELEIFLDFDAYLPESWMPDQRMRIEAYRELGRCRTDADFMAVLAKWRDRFGTPPAAVEDFVKVAKIRAFMERERLSRVEVLRGEGLLVSSPRMASLVRRMRLPASKVRSLAERGLLIVHPRPFTGPSEVLGLLETAVEPLGANPSQVGESPLP